MFGLPGVSAPKPPGKLWSAWVGHPRFRLAVAALGNFHQLRLPPRFPFSHLHPFPPFSRLLVLVLRSGVLGMQAHLMDYLKSERLGLL